MLENKSIGNIEIKIFGEKSDFTLRLSKYVLVDSTGKVLEQSVIDCSFCGLFLLHVLFCFVLFWYMNGKMVELQ